MKERDSGKVAPEEIQIVDEEKLNRFNYSCWRRVRMPAKIRCLACRGLSELLFVPICLAPDGRDRLFGLCQQCGRELEAEIYFFLN